MLLLGGYFETTSGLLFVITGNLVQQTMQKLRGALRGLAYMHDHDRLHQSLGPFSVSLKYVTSRHLVLFYDWGSPLNSEIK
ncbi:Protein kinase superfamily protein [Trifolium repens]|nr:Protein kinase superfamily protein [Trifolium repens]